MHLRSQRGHPEYNTGSISQHHDSELSLWSKDRHPPRNREYTQGGQTMNDYKTVTDDVTAGDLEPTRTASPDQFLVGSYKGQQIRIQNHLDIPVFFFPGLKFLLGSKKSGELFFQLPERAERRIYQLEPGRVQNAAIYPHCPTVNRQSKYAIPTRVKKNPEPEIPEKAE
jgi:hypothetical protein